jgi:hypothetical protein
LASQINQIKTTENKIAKGETTLSSSHSLFHHLPQFVSSSTTVCFIIYRILLISLIEKYENDLLLDAKE